MSDSQPKIGCEKCHYTGVHCSEARHEDGSGRPAWAARYVVTFNATGEAWIAAPSGFEAGQLRLVAWQPLDDDGDSARLRTDLMLNVDFDVEDVAAVLANRGSHGARAFERYEDHNNDKHAALRYATLMVAAEIGKRMEQK